MCISSTDDDIPFNFGIRYLQKKGAHANLHLKHILRHLLTVDKAI